MRTKDSVRIAWGWLNVPPTVVSGSGDFRVTKVSTGIYLVTFDKPFKTVPAIVLQPVGGVFIAQYFTPTEGYFQTYFSNTIGGASVDQAFSFVATGAER